MLLTAAPWLREHAPRLERSAPRMTIGAVVSHPSIRASWSSIGCNAVEVVAANVQRVQEHLA